MLGISGLRGIVGVSFTPEVAAAYAAAFAAWIRPGCGGRRPRICVARDGRCSGEALLQAVSAGLLASGCDVVDLGVAMTPTVAVMIGHHRADGGMVVTASHNPQEWNGLKALDRDGLAPPPEEARSLVEGFTQRRFGWCPPLEQGTSAHEADAARVHVERVVSQLDAEAIRRAGFHVVLDPVNASGCIGGPMLLERLGCRVTLVHGAQTGIFGHLPEPLEGNLEDLRRSTAATSGAACGFAQDPDADRLAICDERGRFIGEEYTLALAALRMLERTGGGVLAANLSTSRMIDDLAARFPGSRVVRTAVGEANVAAAIRAGRGIGGGEGNGGVILPGTCWVRDSLSAMGLVLELLALRRRPLSELVREIPAYSMVKQKLDLAGVGGAAAVPLAVERVARAFAAERVDRADGVRVDVKDGWFHLRPSNTEPIVRIIAEGPDEARARELVDQCATAAGLAASASSGR